MTKIHFYSKNRLVYSLMAIMLILVSIFTISGTTLKASAAIIANGPSKHTEMIKETDTFKRFVEYNTYVYEYDKLTYDVPLKALTYGLDIRTKTSFSFTKESSISSEYSATETISAKLSSKYGTSAEAKIEDVSAKAYSEFAAEFGASYSNTLTRSISAKTFTTQTYNITDPADFGFYVVTLKAYSAKKYYIVSYWTEYTSERKNTKSDWSSNKMVASGTLCTYYYIPTSSYTYVSFEKYDTAIEYASYMDKYHAIY